MSDSKTVFKNLKHKGEATWIGAREDHCTELLCVLTTGYDIYDDNWEENSSTWYTWHDLWCQGHAIFTWSTKNVASIHSVECHVSGKMLFLLINQQIVFGAPRACCVMTLATCCLVQRSSWCSGVAKGPRVTRDLGLRLFFFFLVAYVLKLFSVMSQFC